MAFDPLSSLALGIALDEAVHDNAIGYALSALTLAVALAGLVILARAKQEEQPPPSPPSLLLRPRSEPRRGSVQYRDHETVRRVPHAWLGRRRRARHARQRHVPHRAIAGARSSR